MHLCSEAKFAAQGLTNHQRENALFLKKLKSMFEQLSRIVQTYFSKEIYKKKTKNQQIGEGDDNVYAHIILQLIIASQHMSKFNKI